MKIPVTVYNCGLCGGGTKLSEAYISNQFIFAPCERCGTDVRLRKATCMGFEPIIYEKKRGKVKATLKYLKTALFGPKIKCPKPPKVLYVKETSTFAPGVYDLLTYCDYHDVMKGPILYNRKTEDGSESIKYG